MYTSKGKCEIYLQFYKIWIKISYFKNNFQTEKKKKKFLKSENKEFKIISNKISARSCAVKKAGFLF